MTDIVERLRSRMPSVPAMLDAADEIVRLRESVRIRDGEIERLRFYVNEWARDAGMPCAYCGNDHTPEHACGHALDAEAKAIKAAVLAEREECCALVWGHASSDNVAQRTVDAIRKRIIG